MRRVSLRRAVALGALVAVVGGSGTAALAAQGGKGTASRCTPRLLVLSAMPVEIAPLYAQMRGPRKVVFTSDSRRPYEFWVGRLEGNNVVLGLTGIGTLNATLTTQFALDHFTCAANRTQITGIVFSGTSGGDQRIGDVHMPAQWTLDGTTFYPTDPAMLDVAATATNGIALESQVPLGDPACACVDPHLLAPYSLGYTPRAFAGGDGISSDPFGKRRLPCVPNGGDTFGCEPCQAQAHSVDYVPQFLADAPSFADPQFFQDYNNWQVPAHDWAAQDMETAAVAKVAAAHGVPVIGFRAQSDGAGDPLHLPGFPFTFFVYRQIAADNAATAALAFLKAWSSQ